MLALRLALPAVLVAAVVPRLAADEQRALDEQILHDAGLKVDGPALLHFLRALAPDETQRRQILDLIRQCGDQSFRVRQKAAENLKRIGTPALGILRQSLKDPDPEIVRASTRLIASIEKVPIGTLASAAIRMLGRLKPEGTVEFVLAQVPVAADAETGEALRWALARVAEAGGQANAKIAAALADHSAARRSAAGEALVVARVASVEPEVRKLLNDGNAEVRLRVALALIETAKDKAIVPKLIELLPQAPASLAWRAEDLLFRIADGDGPKVSLSGEPLQREECRKAWVDWWQSHGETVKLDRLDAAPRQLGYTLVLEASAAGRQGKAIEFGPDGKTIRWQIDGLLMPVDAQVLPRSDRVLIAEYHGNRVTERDFQGRIVWSRNVGMPVACQRLPDGNTLIANRQGLVEYNAKDEEVFRHDRNLGDIMAAQKARDGTYVFVTRGGVLARINAQGKAISSFPVGRTYIYSSLQLLPNNRALVSLLSSVAEFDLTTGKQVWQANVRTPVSVSRTSDGRTLAASLLNRRIVELDRDGKVAKEFALPDGGIPYRAKRR